VLFDLAPRQVAAIAGDALPDRYRSRLERFHHGPAAFKVDYALDGPVPWSNAECLQAGTLHLGGTLDEIAAAEAAVASGEVPERPYVLVSQPAVVDPSRAPEGQHTLWTYCHVPNGCTVDMTEAIERQIERFAPEFRDRVLARHVADPAWYERYNPAYVGGDITGGAHTGLQLLFRPTPQLRPYRTPNPRLYMCSASTPPGGGVHGMSGYHAAQAVLRAS
jgi:phytoene dehydrogenase-like protein